MAASASKRAKEDDRRKKEKIQEEKEVAKTLKEEMAKKKENEEAKKMNGSDDDRVMSNVTSMTNLTDPTAYSKDELVEMLKNARISRRSSVKGSAPKENGKPHHKSS